MVEVLCFQILCFARAFLSYYCVFHIPAFLESSNQTSPYRITSLTDSCQRKPCVVCPAPAALSSTPAQLLQRQKGPAQQGSGLQTVFRRLRSSSPPLAAMKTALPSSTEQMTSRTTRVRKRGRTLSCLLTLCIA